MMDIVVSGFRQGDDPVGLRLSEFSPAEPDLESSQINAIQNNGWRLGDNFFFVPVDRDSLKLGGECTEFSINLA